MKEKWQAVKQTASRWWYWLLEMVARPFLWLWNSMPFLHTPLRIMAKPFVWLVQGWRYLGRLGQALTHILHILILPFAWFIRGVGVALLFLWRRLVSGTKIWVSDPLRRFIPWAWRTTIDTIQQKWVDSLPARRRGRRHIASKLTIWRARFRVWFFDPTRPKDAVHAPVVVQPARRTRLIPSSRTVAMGLSGVTLLLAGWLGYIQLVVPPDEVPVEIAVVVTATPGPSATPTETPEPTNTPLPTTTPSPTPITIALTPFPTPDPLAGGGSLVFAQNKDGNTDLFVLSVGQDRPFRLTNDPAVDRNPVWSPDGRFVAFTSNRDGNWELYILDVTSGDLQRVTDNLDFDGGASWSPDGAWLVYEGYRDDNLDIFIVRRDGSEGPIRLTEHAAPDFSPVWSPDGRHIAFTSWRGGNKDIFMMSLDAVRDDQAVNLTKTADRAEDHAVFSPSGRYLAYHDRSAGLDLIYTQELRDATPVGEPLPIGQGRFPAWSPTGDTLAYAHTVNGRDYLLASSLGAWAVAPQTYAADGRLRQIDWSAITFAPKPSGYLADIAGSAPPPLYTETISDTQNNNPPYLVMSVDVEAPLPFFSDRVEQSFLALRERVTADAGQPLLAQVNRAFEPLDAQPLPNEPVRSWHKAGRAFNLVYDEALAFNPDLEILREDEGEATYWRLYLRADVQDGTQGEPLRDIPWDFRARYGSDPTYYDEGGRYKDRIPAGYYVDFTDLAADYGWARVPSAPNWRTYFPGIRFWQFEKREGLTWEAAMLEIYDRESFAAEFE